MRRTPTHTFPDSLVELPPSGRLVLTVPFPTPSQNRTDRQHWAKRGVLRDQCTLALTINMRSQGVGLDVSKGPCVKRKRGVRVVRYGRRQLDYGNLVGGAKHLVDALIHVHLIVDDSPRWCVQEYAQFRVKFDERTVVEIWGLEGEE